MGIILLEVIFEEWYNMDKKIGTDKNCVKEESNMPALAPIKRIGLTPEKKEGLKKMMGKYSGKASLSLIRELRKNESN